jgi:hypothetical protein
VFVSLLSCIASLVGYCVPALAGNVVTAVRVSRPPAFAARADDETWRTIAAVTSFRQWMPREDVEPSLATEFRVAYDAKHLYVLVRAFDPHPDSIVRTVTRRDGTGASDEIGIYIASAGDHRTGYEFYVNAAGAMRDVAISADVREDVSWNAVWDAAVRTDSAGWVAEFRIPFSQLRFPSAARHQFGLLVNRVIQRRAEHVSWPAYRPSRAGIVSQFGLLDGLEGIGESRTVELAPFIRAQSRGARGATAGADLRVGLASNLSLNATVLPDFGQVEADPSVVNLASVETFYPEHRPFFLEGAGAYNVGFNCNAVSCVNEGLFYSRRIGRAPQLASVYGDGFSYDAVPIVGAAKVTGRTGDGVTIGALASTTARLASTDGRTIEPATMYGVARVQQDFRDGQSGVSLVTTLVDRMLDRWTSPYLSHTAIVSGGTFRHRFIHGQYEVWGSATESVLAGSSAAIAAVQENPVHFTQRPGAAVRVDSTRRSIAGDQEELAVGKYGGAFMFETSFERQSPLYDSNDLGYLQRADEQTLATWAAYVARTPRAFYKSWQWNVNKWDTWNASGTRLEDAVNANTHVNLSSNWWLNAGATLGHIGSTTCDHCARGGPALRNDAQLFQWVAIQGDARRAVVPNLNGSWSFTDRGRSRSSTINPTVDLRVSSRFQMSLGVLVGSNHDNTQWLGNFGDGAGKAFAFARLQQQTRALTLRTTYAATSSLSLETYAEPFASDGVYSDVRRLSDATLAPAYADRFVPYAPPPTVALRFGVRQLRATTVLRWEYAPASTVFVVWTHERNGDGLGSDGSWAGDGRDLFALRPINTLTVKASYWISR